MTQLKLHGAFNAQNQDFSYIKINFARCKKETLVYILQDPEAECFTDAFFDSYFSSIRVEIAVTDSYIDL